MTTSDGAVLSSTRVFGAADPARAFNIVVLGDGFRDVEQAAFDAAANDLVQTFTTMRPFDRYTRCMNIFRVNVASTDSGADNPDAGIAVRTYFDSTFGTGGLARLLTCAEATALLVAAQHVPQFTVCLMAVNSPTYGGSGGSVGIFSLASGAMQIAIHEMGHTAFGLADEYDYWAERDEASQAHHPPGEPREPNVTLDTGRSTLKWRWAVDATTPLPTTANKNCALEDTQSNPFPAHTVGCYEGARYYHCGAYRPQFACMMRALGSPFCKVCEAAIARRLDLYSQE